MTLSLTYFSYSFFENSATPGRRFSQLLLLNFAFYYWLWELTEEKFFRDLRVWYLALDVFILGVLIVKYENMKFDNFLNRNLFRLID